MLGLAQSEVRPLSNPAIRGQLSSKSKKYELRKKQSLHPWQFSVQRLLVKNYYAAKTWKSMTAPSTIQQKQVLHSTVP